VTTGTSHACGAISGSESGLTCVDGDWAVKGRRRKRVRFSGCGGEIQTVVFVVMMEVGEIDAVRELISAGGKFGTRRYIDKLIFAIPLSCIRIERQKAYHVNSNVDITV
jgi:hypothetical protein